MHCEDMPTVVRDSRAGVRPCVWYLTIYAPIPYITGEEELGYVWHVAGIL